MSETKTVGVSLTTVLLIIFITLKLTDNIDWSWLWVLSPLWIGLALGIVGFFVISMVLLPVALIKAARKNNLK